MKTKIILNEMCFFTHEIEVDASEEEINTWDEDKLKELIDHSRGEYEYSEVEIDEIYESDEFESD